MGEAEARPLQIGDRVVFYDELNQKFLRVDGFKSKALTCDPNKDMSCIFEITCKQTYQQLKSYKKILTNIGIQLREELEHFKKEEDVDEAEERELKRLGGEGGKLEKERADNEEEVQRMRGEVLYYGDTVQMKHVDSGQYITLSKEAGLQPGSSRLEVTADGGEGSWVDIMPGFKVRKEGDPVSETDQALLKMMKKSTPDRPLYVHTNRETPVSEEGSDIYPECLEVNAFEEKSRYTVYLYSKFDQGNNVLCSGSVMRLHHKEENGFLTNGQVWSHQGEKRRLHVMSVTKHQEVAQWCSNSLWEVEQMDLKTIDELTERAARGEAAEPHEMGGNGRWESLYRLKHKGTGQYMAASFDPDMGLSNGGTNGPVRLYFTPLTRKQGMAPGAFREAHLETLWAIKPVNPKEDYSVPIGLSEGFHLQHAATCYWLHARSAAGSADVGKYYDDPASLGAVTAGEEEVAVQPPSIVRSQRMVQMVPDRPYEDAFGFEATPQEDVLDMNKALKIKPHLQEYAVKLCAEFTAENPRQPPHVEPHPRRTQAQVKGVSALLKDLLGGPGPGFLIPESKEIDPLKRKTEGELSSTQKRRQQMLREQGFLEVLVQMTSGAQPGLPYDNLMEWEPNVFSVCRLTNNVVRHIVDGNTTNCLHMKPHIKSFIDQIGNQMQATDVLLALHKDNKELLSCLDKASFGDWLKVMTDAVEQGKIVGRLELAVSFLSVTCVVRSAGAGAQHEGTAIKNNQDHILDLLFTDDVNREACLAHFEGQGKSIKAKSPVKPFRLMFLEEIFPDSKPEPGKQNKVDKAVQEFFVNSIELYANICANRNAKAIRELSKFFPQTLIIDIIMTDRPGSDRLRAAFCNLFVRLYVDCDAFPADEDPIQLTRVWDEIDESKVHRISDLDEEPFPALKNWIVRFLSDDPDVMSDELAKKKCCTRTRAGREYEGRNTLILAVVKMVQKMVELRCYYEMETPKSREDGMKTSLSDVLQPLFKILNGNTDKAAGHVDENAQSPAMQSKGGQDMGDEDKTARFKDDADNSLLTKTKTCICSIIDTVSSIRMNVRMSMLLLVYKKAYLSQRDGEKYVRNGTRYKGKTKIDPQTRAIFKVLDYEDAITDSSFEGRDLVYILLDLVMYQDKALVSEAFNLMLRQHQQMKECAEKLSQVQLLCSKPQIAFLERGKNLKKQLVAFREGPKKREDYEQVRKTLKEMITTIQLQAKDGETTVDAEVCQGRQELYKNIAVPRLLLDILSPINSENKPVETPVDICRQICEFLTLVCSGRDDTKETLKREGFETFLHYLTKEVGADKLVTELFNDNRTLCTQITAEDIKKFVNLIVTQRRKPRWLGFMNSLVVVRDLPIKKNQDMVIKELIANKTKTMLGNEDSGDKPSLYVNKESWEEHAKSLMAQYSPDEPNTPESEPLRYHVELVNLLCKCAQGKNRAAEERCQQELPKQAIIDGMKDPDTIPFVKRAYIDFLWESYVEIERPNRETQFDKEIWEAMERMAQELEECIDLQYDLNDYHHQADPEAITKTQYNKLTEEKRMLFRQHLTAKIKLSDVEKRSQVQYLYSNVIRFLDGWYGDAEAGTSYYEPDTWGEAFGDVHAKIHGDGKSNATVKQVQQKYARLSTRLLAAVCKLDDSKYPPRAYCEITTHHKECVSICVLRMMKRGVKPTHECEKVARKLEHQGRSLLENVDMFPPPRKALTNEFLTQSGLMMFARDFKALVDRLEEMTPLVRTMRFLIMDGNKYLQPYGDNKEDSYEPEKYVQRAVKEVDSTSCRPAVKAKLLHFLTLMITLPDFPKVKGKSEDDEERRDEIRVRFCNSKIAVPELVISTGAREGRNDAVFKAVLELALALVGSGHPVVQNSLLQILKQKIEEYSEPFFEELENRIIAAKNECKASKNFYDQQAEQAKALQELEELEIKGFANAGQTSAKDILKMTAPPPEKFVEVGYICHIMKLVQQLCEDNNQAFKKFVNAQEGAPKSHNLVQAAVAYLEVWQRNAGEHNITYGINVFDMLTEVVIGPCPPNQSLLGEELKMECINGILMAKPRTAGPQLVELEQHYTSLKQSCVLLLQSMLEAQKKGGRVLKKFEDLDQRRLKEDVIKLHQVVKEGLDWRYKLKMMMRPFLPAALRVAPIDPEQVKYAFQLVTLLRRIHDPLDNPKQRRPFIEYLLDGYEVTATKGPMAQVQKDAEAKASDAFTHFIDKMGRIEISRENEKLEPRLERVYFEIPERCSLLTETSKEDLKMHIDRTSREDKLKAFVEEEAQDLGYEMGLQSKLSQFRVYKFLDTYREFWKAFSFYLAFAINGILLLSVDHEDKYDVDPSADLDSDFGSTPYNLLDITSFPVRSWGTIAVCEGISGCGHKVAYIPSKMQIAIKYLGYTQTFTSTINWVIFIVGFGPVKVRKAWKKKHENAQADLKLEDPTYEKVNFDYMLYGKGVIGKPLFFLRSLLFILLDTEVLYRTVYIVMTVLGNVVSEFFFAFHLMDLLSRDPELISVLEAIIRPIVTIGKTLFLSLIVMYIFTIGAFVLFHDQFNPGIVKHDNLCNSIMQCLLFTVYSGIISSEIWADMGISDLWPRHSYGPQHDPENNWLIMFASRWIYDVAFFFLIGVVLIGGVLFGIILDNFTNIREEKSKIMAEQRDGCFICDKGRDVFDKDGAGFNTHVATSDGDHNMWQYLYFIIYLDDIDQADYNGPESYVAKLRDEGDVRWMPRDAMVLEGQDEGEADVEEMLKKQVETLHEELALIKRDNKIANDTVAELLKTLQEMEQKCGSS